MWLSCCNLHRTLQMNTGHNQTPECCLYWSCTSLGCTGLRSPTPPRSSDLRDTHHPCCHLLEWKLLPLIYRSILQSSFQWEGQGHRSDSTVHQDRVEDQMNLEIEQNILFQGRSSQVRSGKVRSDHIKSGQVRSGQGRLGQVRSCYIRAGQVR